MKCKISDLILKRWVLMGVVFNSLLIAAAGNVTLEQILRPVEMLALQPAVAEAHEAAARERRATAPVRISLTDVLDNLQAHLSDTVADGDQLELTSNAQWRPLVLPGDTQWIAYTDSPLRPDPRGNWFPLVRIEADGELIGSWRLPVKVGLYRMVWMSYQRLGRGDIPVAPAVKPVLRNIYLERGSPIPATEDISDYELVNPVAEGRLLSWNDLTLRPLIRRGDTVEVRLENGPLAVNMTAQSLQDGVKGDRILIRNTRSRREFAAVVTGPNQVRIP